MTVGDDLEKSVELTMLKYSLIKPETAERWTRQHPFLLTILWIGLIFTIGFICGWIVRG